MQIQYSRNFAVGANTHILRGYEKYTDSTGLENMVEVRESPRIADCLKGLALTAPQRARLRALMSERQDGIVLESGEYRRY